MMKQLSKQEFEEYIALRHKFSVGDRVRLITTTDYYTVIRIRTIRCLGIVVPRFKPKYYLKIEIVKYWSEEDWQEDVDCHIKHDRTDIVYATKLCNLTVIGSFKADNVRRIKK
jgi:hypothetical protein